MRRSKSGREAGGQARHIEPGTPWENGCTESFNGKVRGEVLNAGGHAASRGPRARGRLERNCNTKRPHSALGAMTPCEFSTQLGLALPASMVRGCPGPGCLPSQFGRGLP
ncbi:MAG: transposase [Candidatus Sumerlaeia bacterium]|nr:transposase [Candidatus Sumerlaeia bacterium]